jgi:hypothetical protein
MDRRVQPKGGLPGGGMSGFDGCQLDAENGPLGPLRGLSWNNLGVLSCRGRPRPCGNPGGRPDRQDRVPEGLRGRGMGHRVPLA